VAHELIPLDPDVDDPLVVEPVKASRARRVAVAAVAVVVAVTMVAQLWPDPRIDPAPVAAAADEDPESVTILAGAPASIDPAKHGDLGSASYVTQLFETLTAVDPSLAVRPALAESWSVEEGGTRVVFTLREGLTFSDGSSLTATDVVRSWRRLFDPREPSPLASLIADVTGARALLSGETDDVSTLGVRADGDTRVIVDLERGGSDLPAIVSGAPFAIVPRSAGDGEILPTPGSFVGSGGYLVKDVTDDAFVL
jgi:ABC-type transport system substrate-binding protein